MRMHKFVDLFSGIGGFRIALEKKGMECVFACDADKRVREIYRSNFNDTPNGDIKDICEKQIPKHDILCAGFPCQTFSSSGNRRAFADARGRLFYDIIRIARHHRPFLLLLENVKNILSIDGGKVIKTIEGELRNINYRAAYSLLNSGDYGIPQKRERVYFVCIRNDSSTSRNLEYKAPVPTFKEVYLKDIADKQVDQSLYINRDDIVLEKKCPGPSLRPVRLGHLSKNKGSQGYRIYSMNGHAITLSANGGGIGGRTGLYLDKGGIRKLSLNECKHIMTFPQSHVTGPGGLGYKQLGNAVMPKMVEKIYDAVVTK